MTEPNAIAESTEEVVPGVWTWRVSDDRIGGYTSSAHAVRSDDVVVLIDPLPLTEEALSGLGRVEAICLTTSHHQRSAWRLRRELGARVWAPRGVQDVEEEPDASYWEGDSLPGGLRAVFSPGPGTMQHSLLLEREGGVLFTSDLFLGAEGRLMFVPAQYMHDAEQARRTAEQLLDLDFTVLCVGHGTPIVDDPKTAIRGALEQE